MTTPIFVESAKTVYEGERARRYLEQTNDTRFETEDGVVEVDKARWKVAQEYERYTWIVHNRNTGTDRNEIHFENFDSYNALPADVGKVIELGCGVFTNLRLILQEREASEIYLLDPLATAYQKEHAHCNYADNELLGRPVTVVDKAIEDWKTRNLFDTIVMINVLPHCRDARAVFDFIDKHLKPGGWLVIGEFPREHEIELHYDAGHPIALRAHVLEDFLSQFEEVFANGWHRIVRKPE